MLLLITPPTKSQNLSIIDFLQNYTKYEQKEKRFNQGRCSLA
ncbi:hypothetical protein MNB_SM-7-1109 [hydrothermal vent metagenome]|uniref:Uncharacterized protein n=1 Tax=hydrothermal vent metagenome TaxID=652676 RepID=A0A1W1BAC2_9ZZZZ